MLVQLCRSSLLTDIVETRRCIFHFQDRTFHRSTDSNNFNCVLFQHNALRSSAVAPSIGPGCDYA